MKTTIAHELFHAVQRSYRDYVEGSGHAYFYEMSSTWIEDIIYPDINNITRNATYGFLLRL